MEKDRMVREQDKLIQALQAAIGQMRDDLAGKEIELQSLNERLGGQGANISGLQAAYREKEAALNQIYNSRGWKALLVYYGLRDRLFPLHSKRRAAVKFCGKLARSITRIGGFGPKGNRPFKKLRRRTERAGLRNAQFDQEQTPEGTREADTRGSGDLKLHIGCGSNYLPGWINIDISPSSKADLVCDVTKRIPFPDEGVRLIHTEDFIEHLSQEGARSFLGEASRVLAHGGYLRVLTPNLAILAKQYLERDENALRWYVNNFAVVTYAEMFNMGMRMGGHTFLYDEETLDLMLNEARFEVFRAVFKQSCHPELCNLDIRGDGMSIYRDCRKT